MINLVVSLVAEARPLIDYFSLSEAEHARGFRVYQGDHVNLVVTGIGKTAAAAGAAYLSGFGGSAPNEAWLNVGIAGHANLAIGEGVHALRVTDDATGRNWYPPQIAALPGSGQSVLTVEQPEKDYSKEVVYDMESAAFYPTALHFSMRELVQCYKIISDNREVSATQINKLKVRQLIEGHINNIAAMVEDLNDLAQDLANTAPKLADFDHFVERWHFTVAQEHELRSLLQRWAVLAPDVPVWDEHINRCPSARSLLAELRDRINRLPVKMAAQN